MYASFFCECAGSEHALLLGGRPELRGFQVAYSKNQWLFVDCWRWHENAGGTILLLSWPFSSPLWMRRHLSKFWEMLERTYWV